MLRRTHSVFAPWTITKAEDKKSTRLNIIRDLLSRCEYHGKTGHGEFPDPNQLFLFDEALLTNGPNGALSSPSPPGEADNVRSNIVALTPPSVQEDRLWRCMLD